MLPKLLRLRLMLAWARVRRSRAALVAVALIVAGPGIGGYLLMRSVFNALHQHAPGTAPAVVVTTFAVGGLLQVVAGMRNGVRSLVLDSDVEIYLAAPVPQPALFGLKVAETAAASPVSSVLLLSAGYAYGVSRGFAPAFPFAVAAVAFTAATAALPGLLLTMLITRVVPPRRVREILTVVPAVLGALLGVAGSSVGIVVDRSRLNEQDTEQLVAATTAVARWLPTAWPGAALAHAASGNWMQSVAYLFATTLLAGGLTVPAYVLFRTSYVRMAALRSGSGQRVRTGRAEAVLAPLSPPVRAVATKEWREMRRDLGRLTSTFVPLVLITAFVLRPLLDPGGRDPDDVLTGMIFAPIVLTGIALQAFRAEGRNIALLRVTPATTSDVLKGKILALFVPFLVLAWIATAGIAAAGWIASFTAALVFAATPWLLGGLLVINTCLGAITTDFSKTDPRPSGLIGLFAFVPTLFFVGANVGAALWVVRRLAGSLEGSMRHPAVGLLAGAAFAASVALLAWMWRRAVRRLDGLEVS